MEGAIACSRGNHQVEGGRVGGVDKVEMRFQDSKGNQGRKGKAVVKTGARDPAR